MAQQFVNKPQTINTKKAINIFDELMKPNASFRILRLLGRSMTGKTHLMKRVFPFLAVNEYHVCIAIVDLGNPVYSIIDMLDTIFNILGRGKSFPNFQLSYQKLTERPSVEISKFRSVLSSIEINVKNDPENYKKIARHLTSQFVDDLENFDEEILLLFDIVDCASEITLTWLMDALLVQLSLLPCIKIILAGRSVPEANANYAAICRIYTLDPVDGFVKLLTVLPNP